MIKALSFLLLASTCFGQVTMQQMQPFFNGQSGSSIPTPFLWWVYSDSLATNAAVTNWVDRMQGSILTNGAAANRPTNSASGIGFTGTRTGLTNIQISLGTNYTIVVWANQTKSMDYQTAITPLVSDNGNAWTMGLYFNGVGTGHLGYISSVGANVDLTVSGHVVGAMTCYTLVESNSVAAAGQTFGYTNAVLGIVAARQSVSVSFGATGYNKAAATINDYFVGFIKQIIVYTNVMTPTQIQTIYNAGSL